MEKLLFLSAHLPAKESRQAGQKTAFRNLGWLAERYEVYLLAFRSQGDPVEAVGPLKALSARLEIIDVTNASRIRGVLCHPFLPLPVAARSSHAVRETVRQWFKDGKFARVHCEWSQLAQYIGEFRAVAKRTLYIHDILAQWAKRKADRTRKRFWQFEVCRIRAWEKKSYAQFTKLYVPSAKDCNLIGQDLQARTTVLPLYFDVYRGISRVRHDGLLRLLFWGALGRAENTEAAHWLCAELAPRLRATKIRFKIVIAGSDPSPAIKALGSSDIEVTGYIPDPTEKFSTMDLAVLPLFQGAGVKVKVLECLASGLPVLTTSIGREGIEADEADGLITLPSDPGSFVSALAQLEGDRSRLARLSAAAFAWGGRQESDRRHLLLD